MALGLSLNPFHCNRMLLSARGSPTLAPPPSLLLGAFPTHRPHRPQASLSLRGPHSCSRAFLSFACRPWPGQALGMALQESQASGFLAGSYVTLPSLGGTDSTPISQRGKQRHGEVKECAYGLMTGKWQGWDCTLPHLCSLPWEPSPRALTLARGSGGRGGRGRRVRAGVRAGAAGGGAVSVRRLGLKHEVWAPSGEPGQDQIKPSMPHPTQPWTHPGH